VNPTSTDALDGDLFGVDLDGLFAHRFARRPTHRTDATSGGHETRYPEPQTGFGDPRDRSQYQPERAGIRVGAPPRVRGRGAPSFVVRRMSRGELPRRAHDRASGGHDLCEQMPCLVERDNLHHRRARGPPSGPLLLTLVPTRARLHDERGSHDTAEARGRVGEHGIDGGHELRRRVVGLLARPAVAFHRDDDGGAIR
jgi:hypothetical protein